MSVIVASSQWHSIWGDYDADLDTKRRVRFARTSVGKRWEIEFARAGATEILIGPNILEGASLTNALKALLSNEHNLPTPEDLEVGALAGYILGQMDSAPPSGGGSA